MNVGNAIKISHNKTLPATDLLIEVKIFEVAVRLINVIFIPKLFLGAAP
jgi:hypothetical protein